MATKMEYLPFFKMRTWIKVLVTLVLVSLLGSTSSVIDLKIKDIFEEYGFKVSGDISLDVDLPYWGQSATQVEAVCRNKHKNVSQYLQYYSEGVKDAVNFLCAKDNLKDYKSYLTCFNNSEVKKVFDTCKIWKEDAKNGLDGSQTIGTNLTQCSLEDVYQSCTSGMLQSLRSCGKNASKWFDMWWRKMNYYYHVSISCIEDSGSKGGEESDEWSIVLGVILAVTACLLVIGIIVFVVFLLGRRKLGSGDEDPAHARGPRGFGQRREVPPPYALVVNAPRENAGEGESGNTALRLVDRENRLTAETEARLYDGNITSATGNGLILPPPYSNSVPPPDVFGNETGIPNAPDSDKEEELLSLETSTTRCSSINLQTAGSGSVGSLSGALNGSPDGCDTRDPVRAADRTTPGRGVGELTGGRGSSPSAPRTDGMSTPNKNLPSINIEGLCSERTSSIV